MPEFKPNEPIETAESAIVVEQPPDRPLGAGRHRFRLVVVDDAGNQSQPDEITVIVIDDQAPTAVLEGPGRISFGKAIDLSGVKSTDAGGGRIVRYIWTLLD